MTLNYFVFRSVNHHSIVHADRNHVDSLGFTPSALPSTWPVPMEDLRRNVVAFPKCAANSRPNPLSSKDR